jgi:hypothetical protein
MFIRKKKLAQTMEVLTATSQKLTETVANLAQAVRLAQETQTVADSWKLTAETWRRLYEEATAKDRPLDPEVIRALQSPQCRLVN